MYLGVQGLMPNDLGDVTEATMTRIREHGFTGAATRFFDPLSATRQTVTRLRQVMNAGGEVNAIPCTKHCPLGN